MELFLTDLGLSCEKKCLKCKQISMVFAIAASILFAVDNVAHLGNVVLFTIFTNAAFSLIA